MVIEYMVWSPLGNGRGSISARLDAEKNIRSIMINQTKFAEIHKIDAFHTSTFWGRSSVNQVNALIPIGCCTTSATCTPLIISATNCDLYGTTTSYYIIVVFRILRYISEFITTVTWFHTPIDLFPYARSIGSTTRVTNNHHIVQ